MADPTGSAMSRSSARSRSAGSTLPGQQLSLTACLDAAEVSQGSLFVEPEAAASDAGSAEAEAGDEDSLDPDALAQAGRTPPQPPRRRCGKWR